MGQPLTSRTELATTPDNTDFMHVVDVSDTTDSAEGSSKKITYSNLIPDASTTVKGKVELATDAEAATSTDTVRALTPSNGQSIVAGATVAAAGKTTPVDADSFGIVDSEASNVLKELTFTNLKAFLKTYFDTLYATLTGNQTFSGNNLFTGSIIGKFPLQEGALINGRILPADASGLTLALKTFAGTDPSASDPVYVVLNGVVRSITAALSVAKADGTNWGNAGAAELAAKEIDWFAYLGYNATDGVTIGFSRIPFATKYGDFSATTTNEKYCAISTITNAASTDYYAVVGRFAATLSAGAGYTWTVPTYAADNLIQYPIYETRWSTWLPTYTGFSSAPTGAARYKVVMDILYLVYDDSGTSNSATFNMTLPFTLVVVSTGSQNLAIKVSDNSANPTTIGLIGLNIGASASNLAKIGLNLGTAAANAYGGFTTSGSKGASFSLICRI